MLILVIIKVSFKSLLANKLRSILAMLGIIIGVGAVIAMLAIGAGAQKQVLDRMTAMGTNLLVIRPGQRIVGGVVTGQQQTLTVEDAQAIIDELPGARRVAPVLNGNLQAKYLNKNSRINVLGTVPAYLPVRNFEVEHGRGFTEREAEQLAHVAILGPMTAENLFGKDDPIGQTIKMQGINFTVVGLLKAKGDQGWYNADDQAIIPFSTAIKQVFGQSANKKSSIKEIDVQAGEDADVTQLQEDVTAILRKRHHLAFGTPDDFSVRNQAEMLEAASANQRTFTVLLACVGSISLLVGGIGIMNIMLVTVTERTREIGVRKAIGARRRDILGQFLLEAVLMSGVGGFIGMGMGIGSANLIGHFTQYPTIVETSAVVISLSFAIAIGVFFGFYPAHSAAQLDPIEALRYE